VELIEKSGGDLRSTTARSRERSLYAVSAAVVGWTLEAYEFFVVVFIVDTLARDFQVAKASIIMTFAATLAMRPVGALCFGVLADRYGRRKPLLAIGAYFSVIALLSGAAVNYPMFLVLRALYGIGMGGFWGVGASLALETAPSRWRGILSGVIQAGYPLGYLLAAVMARLILPVWGWRPMCWAAIVPAILTMLLIHKSHESQVWNVRHKVNISAIVYELWAHRQTFAYVVIALTLMVGLSHGTQDLYPDFLKTEHGVTSNLVAEVAMIYSVGAILGAIFAGQSSEFLGRRRTIGVALLTCVLAIPTWVFGRTLTTLAVGAFIMQVGVSGAWGVIPAHLNELAPDGVRALFGGLAYQFGVLLGSLSGSIEYSLKNHCGYEWALAIFESFTIAALMIVFWVGPEKKGRKFLYND
jgi:SHS family lactate transporter-like MFS transporter